MIAATFGYSLGVGALPIQRVQLKADRRDARGTGKRVREIEVPKEIHITPRMYQKLTEKIAGKARRKNSEFPDAPLVEASPLLRRKSRTLRARRHHLHPFHLAHPPLSRPDRPSHPERRFARIPRKNGWKGPCGNIRCSAKWSSRAKRGISFSSQTKTERKNPPPSPWSKRRDHEAHQQAREPLSGPIPLEELHTIADESSQSERRADEAERGLLEWKKVKFMERRIGEDFDGLIISVTKFGFFVELTDLFVEGLVPLNTLEDDHYTFHEATRQIIGQHSRKTYSLGDRIRVLVDRIDPVEKKIQFAIIEEQPHPASSHRRK